MTSREVQSAMSRLREHLTCSEAYAVVRLRALHSAALRFALGAGGTPAVPVRDAHGSSRRFRFRYLFCEDLAEEFDGARIPRLTEGANGLLAHVLI